MKAVVVAHGDVAPSDRSEAAGADMLIAADGGALALERWDIVPRLIVGDLDSLGHERAARLGQRGATVIPFPVAKSESDLELAMRYAIESGADDIVLLGLFGGARLDHALANALLLADPTYRGRAVRAVYASTQVRALHAHGTLELAGPVGSLVTLLPVRDDAGGVRTEGLRYPLAGELLHFGRSRGLSNVVASHPASVSLERGVLLVIEIHEGGGT
ncbi:MAG TPA: thiamine diphosphokinase [Candidatus Limnocylindria bacterium]|nr:thiamine diphosphokinase [Candidatus Limnocylindria bacterium]